MMITTLRAWMHRHVVALMIATWIAGGILTGYGYLQAKETHTALCGMRSGLADDVRDTQTFLADHPENTIHIVTRGRDVTVTRASLLKTLEAQKRRLAGLDALNCSEETP